MLDNTDNDALINLAAPALRMLLQQGGKPSLVTAQPESDSGLIIDLKEVKPDPLSLVAFIKERIQSCKTVPAVVNLRGVSGFSINQAPLSTGRVAGRIAVITGAAQGFGLEIAQALAAEGACVVLADINAEGAGKAAQAIIDRHGERRAAGIELNVTDIKSVRNMISSVVKIYGGFDILISNAGVLRAESVKTQSERDFDFTTSVNYKGYFLCVQAGAPVLAVQHMADPGYTSDIIQINSKSGLAGSNRNGAYAGSKFGGIGLTQSFALELVDDGIKVNSVCPGNFYDGPLWSDPDKGLFVQYLRSGKVPGARTVDDVRRAYESKAPMKRGCTTSDVMKAIYYLIEQQYETGQALPVTGGQIMLN